METATLVHQLDQARAECEHWQAMANAAIRDARQAIDTCSALYTENAALRAIADTAVAAHLATIQDRNALQGAVVALESKVQRLEARKHWWWL